MPKRVIKNTIIDVARVVKPHGGSSYNPSQKDHVELVDQEIKKEIEKDRKSEV